MEVYFVRSQELIEYTGVDPGYIPSPKDVLRLDLLYTDIHASSSAPRHFDMNPELPLKTLFRLAVFATSRSCSTYASEVLTHLLTLSDSALSPVT